jgi:hypothetical protein
MNEINVIMTIKGPTRMILDLGHGRLMFLIVAELSQRGKKRCKLAGKCHSSRTPEKKQTLSSIVTMFTRIDNYLASHSPHWYRTPTIQTATLGIVFFWVFAAFTTLQFYARSTYGPELAADSVSAVYFCFTVSCSVAPSVVNKFG